MRLKFINFLKQHPSCLDFFWSIGSVVFTIICMLTPKKKRILFASFGGRGFNDSSKAIYDEICKRPEFNDFELVWAFVNPEKFQIPRGEKVKIDTISFFITLFSSKIWIWTSQVDS